MSAAGGGLLVLLADAALKATAVMALALLADTALRRSSAALRHLVWTVAVAGVLLLPLASASLPSLGSAPWPDLRSGVEEGESRPAAVQVDESNRSEGIPPVVRSGSEALRGDGGATLPGSGHPWVPPSESESGAEPGIGTALTGSGVSDTRVGPATEARSRGWTSVASIAWGLGVLLVLLGLGAERVFLRLAARRAGPFGRGRVRDRAREVAGELGLARMPRLLRVEDGEMPATWGVFRHTVSLPARATSWPDDRLRSVLAHEMAHVRRRDCAVQTAAVVACALYWFHPLVWLAAARLRRERELAADDEVLALGTRPSSYARELLTLARSEVRPGPALTATAMAAREGLSDRIRSVVSEGGSRRVVSGSLAGRAAAIGALLLLPLASLSPAPADGSREAADPADPAGEVAGETPTDGSAGFRSRLAPDGCWEPGRAHHMEVHASERRHQLEWEGDDCEGALLLEGGVRFTPDFTDVAGLSGDGLLRIREETDDYRREVEYRPAPGGSVERTFRRGGDVADPTAAEEAWIRERLVTVLRQTGVAAGERVAWTVGRSGPDGVLDEIERIASDRVATRYMDELLDRTRLDEDHLRRLLALGARRIGSDSRLAGILGRSVKEYPGTVAGPAREAFREAAGTVGSDGSLGGLVETMVARGEAGEELVSLALQVAASGIGSDGQMSRFLRRTVDDHPALLAGPLREDVRAAAGTVGSDGSLGGVVEAMVTHRSTTPGMVEVALEAARTIGSDGQMASFLVKVAERHPGLVRDGGPLAGPFERALASVGSDGEELRVRRALARAGSSR